MFAIEPEPLQVISIYRFLVHVREKAVPVKFIYILIGIVFASIVIDSNLNNASTWGADCINNCYDYQREDSGIGWNLHEILRNQRTPYRKFVLVSGCFKQVADQRYTLDDFTANRTGAFTVDVDQRPTNEESALAYLLLCIFYVALCSVQCSAAVLNEQYQKRKRLSSRLGRLLLHPHVVLVYVCSDRRNRSRPSSA